MWNELPLKINPVIWDFGWFSFRWYSLTYFLVIFTVFLLIHHRLKKREILYFNNLPQANDRLFSVFSFAILGALLGAKLGYIFFYDWQSFIASPLKTINPFSSGKLIGFYGLSFHGGLIGSILGSFIACQKESISWRRLLDLFIPTFPLAYFWGRMGNFFNGELFGKITSMPWGMYFPADPFSLRHPSQLYEAFGEGIFLFLIFWPIRNYQKLQNNWLFVYLFSYGFIRFFLEFFREEPFFLFDFLTKGQILCLIMMFTGIIGYLKKTSSVQASKKI